jgi:hypothetical protein
MTVVNLVRGPEWVAAGLDELTGLYPLRVEPAVGRLVERLLPGVITTTTGARYYALHTLAWADARARDLNDEAAEEFVRRCEVVMAAVSLRHREVGHLRRLPAAHGEDQIKRFVYGDLLDVGAAAARGGFSKGGFAGTYFAPERTVGLLHGAWPPHVGSRTDLGPLRSGLGDILALAREAHLPGSTIAAATHLCPCHAADAPDGAWLRMVMFEHADAEVEGDRNRQLAALLLLESLAEGHQQDPERAFRLAHGFGGPIEGDGTEVRARRAWRAAILRNYSVSAWRHLWSWLSTQLAGDAMTASELADRLADAVGSGPTRVFIDDLPPRTGASGLLPVEEGIRDSDQPVPLVCLRQLAISAQRLDDLDAETRAAFVGRDHDDLGPAWVEHQLAEHAAGTLADVARDLVDTMLRRVRRVALSKMALSEDLRPYVPTRLRDRDGVLSMVGIEPDSEVSLRTWTLTQILAGLGSVERSDAGYRVTPAGEQLRDRLAAVP